MYIGLHDAFNQSTSSQAGEFVFRDYVKTNEDETETPIFHIEFKNTGVNPMTGEKITNTSYLWDSFDFKEADILLSWTPYYPTEEVQGGTDWLNDYIENVSDEDTQRIFQWNMVGYVYCTDDIRPVETNRFTRSILQQ